VLDYLARYTQRVAISNHRILDLSEGQVRFSYRDRRHDNVLRTTSLPPDEFIRRFLLHVLPKGLMRIRRYGFLANRLKPQLLPICRTLLGEPSLAAEAVLSPAEIRARLLERMGIDPSRCPKCHNPTLVRAGPLPPLGHLPRGPPAPRVTVLESS
jgi:hypothetical protein